MFFPTATKTRQAALATLVAGTLTAGCTPVANERLELTPVVAGQVLEPIMNGGRDTQDDRTWRKVGDAEPAPEAVAEAGSVDAALASEQGQPRNWQAVAGAMDAETPGNGGTEEVGTGEPTGEPAPMVGGTGEAQPTAGGRGETHTTATRMEAGQPMASGGLATPGEQEPVDAQAGAAEAVKEPVPGETGNPKARPWGEVARMMGGTTAGGTDPAMSARGCEGLEPLRRRGRNPEEEGQVLATLQRWCARKGETLSEVAARWTKEVGWEVRVATNIDWVVGADVLWEGDLLEALGGLAQAFRTRPSPLFEKHPNDIVSLRDDGQTR